MSSSVKESAASAGDNPVVENGARLGFAASGLLHLVIGWIALHMAWGDYSGSADQSGALAYFSGTAMGMVLLWVVAGAFGLLALWQFTETFVVHEWFDRGKHVGKGLLYALLAYTAVTVVTGSSSGSGDTSSMTGTLMTYPYGRLAVGAVGLGIIGVGGYHVYKGWVRKFLEDLREHPGPWVVHAGRFGYVAKGIALVIVGGLFVAAAATADPEKAEGLDGALQSLTTVPYGKALLVVIAIGLFAYGVYSFGRAKYAKV